ncbi:MAG TPA: hypothetical protein VJU78_06250 [Chitinophagaceae bacterium]|nr:hypothetical protein [Chitinophagaceae bacterium]
MGNILNKVNADGVFANRTAIGIFVLKFEAIYNLVAGEKRP